MSIEFCPRCGERSYEILRTHSYCINCSYFPEENKRDEVFEAPIDSESKYFLTFWSKHLEAVL
jgi:hypothetical protein